MKLGSGLVRGDDGLLRWTGGRHYNEPGEAVKTWWKGELRLGCNAEVFSNWSSHPCGATPKHDPDANGNLTRCGRHSLEAMEKARARREKEDEERRIASKNRVALCLAEKEIEVALRSISAGHNDPRALAQRVIDAVDAARIAVKGKPDAT